MTYEIISERRVRNPERIKNPKDLFNLVKRYAGKRQEYFIVITLTNEHTPISVVIVSIGTTNRTLVHPRDVFIKAIKDNALAIVVCHNHPSGNTCPSEDDMEVTETLFEAGKIIGIPVIDHLVFTKNEYFSFQEKGFFKNREFVGPK